MDTLTLVQCYRLLSSLNNKNLKMPFFLKDPVFPSLLKFESHGQRDPLNKYIYKHFKLNISEHFKISMSAPTPKCMT